MFFYNGYLIIWISLCCEVSQYCYPVDVYDSCTLKIETAYIYRLCSFVKQGDNALGSVCLSVSLYLPAS